jgi:hypothetical protein
MTVVLDASAILAFLHGEKGADVVEEHLADEARCGAASWAEVAQKIRGAGRDWSLSRALLASYGMAVENVTGPMVSGRPPGGVGVRVCRWPIGCAYRWRTGCRRRQ